ncbi:hypothetical protein IAT38_000812 [Cryptococcus sp. DSM 104549]
MYPSSLASHRRADALRILATLLAWAGAVKAQTSNSTCKSTADTSWMFNSAGESPCLVWAKIQSLCLSSTSYLNVPPLLDPSWSYNAPTSASSVCQCNSVSYSLMAACTYCQWSNATIPSEESWSSSCPSYSNDGLGFLENSVQVPVWASVPVGSSGSWDPSTAQSGTATTPQSIAYSTTLSRSFPSSTTSNPFITTTSSSQQASATTSISGSTGASSATASSTAAADNGSDTKSSNKWGPIVGGVLGGIAGLVLLLLFFRWFKRRHSTLPNPYSPSSPASSPGKKKQKKKARVPYPYPRAESIQPGRSFLDMLVGPKGEEGSRNTELLNDPEAFADPRPAPRAPIKSRSMLRSWQTTSQRLAEEPSTASSDDSLGKEERTGWKGAFLSSERGSTKPTYTTTTQRLAQQRDTLTPSELDSRASSISPLPPAHLAPTPDFSQPPSLHRASANPTLPSLYEPPTGAPAWTQSMMESPMSKYPTATVEFGRERPVSEGTIGAALGSGVGWRTSRSGQGRWSGESVPEMPAPAATKRRS